MQQSWGVHALRDSLRSEEINSFVTYTTKQWTQRVCMSLKDSETSSELNFALTFQRKL